ncbi:MAG: hypothetical protein ABJB34_12740 [Acidobacteriota bacterium]
MKVHTIADTSAAIRNDAGIEMAKRENANIIGPSHGSPGSAGHWALDTNHIPNKYPPPTTIAKVARKEAANVRRGYFLASSIT